MIIFLIIEQDKGKVAKVGKHTVYGNSNTLGQHVAICTNECGNLSQRVDGVIILWHIVWWLRVDDFEVKLIGLGYGSNGSGTNIALMRYQISSYGTELVSAFSLRRMYRAFQMPYLV